MRIMGYRISDFRNFLQYLYHTLHKVAIGFKNAFVFYTKPTKLSDSKSFESVEFELFSNLI